jgi:hypothetical protein
MDNNTQFSGTPSPGGPVLGRTGMSLFAKILIAIISVGAVAGLGYFGYGKFMKSPKGEVATDGKVSNNGAASRTASTPLPSCDQLVSPQFMLDVAGLVKEEGKLCTYANPKVDPESRVVFDQDAITIGGYCQEGLSWEELEAGIAYMGKGGQSNMAAIKDFASVLNEVGRGSYRFYSMIRDTKTRTVEMGNAMFLGSNKKCMVALIWYVLPKDTVIKIAKEIDKNLK